MANSIVTNLRGIAKASQVARVCEHMSTNYKISLSEVLSQVAKGHVYHTDQWLVLHEIEGPMLRLDIYRWEAGGKKPLHTYRVVMG